MSSHGNSNKTRIETLPMETRTGRISPSSHGNSNKTRIETSKYLSHYGGFPGVHTAIPIKQGLKLFQPVEDEIDIDVHTAIPIKQGLKQFFLIAAFLLSVKVHTAIPIKQGLKLHLFPD